MTIYDLHAHSTASDGSCTPAELVALAEERKIDWLALTDHDTTAGIDSAVQSAASCVNLLPGVEISVSWQSATVHILGLGIDPANENLQQGLLTLREFREWRAREIADLLDQAGIHDVYQDCDALAKGGLISRTHFAQVLVERGHAKDIRQVFKRYLVRNRPGFVPGQWASLEEAISWILAAGGVPVIAHPARYALSATKLRQLLESFISFGGLGLEVVSGSHSDRECFAIADYCKRYNLFGSSGSDFHGQHHPWRKLGDMRPLPDGVMPLWEQPCWDQCVQNAKAIGL